ncbi:LSU ribosomal protein L7/L12 (P1/P2) [Candidatus Nasuia deltocephalinicola]|uniref:50S ribosomal protein L7/L12 n=1 Tax=Candidatus Nasuia deltocephalincola TaxID=1160784 RepID=A0A7G6UHI5_9PROT|nr:LSU ribosomal protein L7/L12 (P1/P2) [Candidatus Nasuia deltocephalinicola]
MKLDNILKIIENMTLLDLNNLVKIIENKYKFENNFSLKKDNNKEEKEDLEKSKSYSINLLDFGKNKISVIKIVKDLNNIGLKDAKNLVESCPVILKKAIDYKLANSLKENLESVGAKIELVRDE